MVIRWISLVLFISVFGCTETPVTSMDAGFVNPRPRPNRDFGVRRDMRVVPDMAIQPMTTRNESRSTFFPGRVRALWRMP